MNNVISFGNGDIISPLQLKLIAYDIIEYAIKDAYKITDDGIDPEYINSKATHRFYNTFNILEETKMLYQILEFNIIYNKMEDNYIYNIKEFVRTYNIHDHNLSIYVFCVLHECGHMVFNQYFKDRVKDFENYLALRANIDSGIFLALHNYVDDADYDCAFDYCYNPDEQLATTYSYQHFKRVWDLLSYRGLINV